MSLFAELKRRNVFKVGVAYVVVAWLILQVSDIILNNIEAPGWVFRVIMLVLVLSLPIVLIFAWAFELTPDGIKRDHEVDRSQSIAPSTGKKLNSAILVLMALGMAYLLVDKFYLEKGASGSDSGSVTALPEAASQAGPDPTLTPPVSRQSVAVLPFDNRSKLEDDVFFVEGVHDDLLTSLARIGSLKVISRTSVSRYRDSEKSIPEIAAELGVATVMEGAVQRAGDMVRINVQLIDAQTDEHLWAEIFDRELTTQNLFAIQSEISTAIAKALEATLSPREQQRLADIPTESLAAYNAYLRGRQFMARRSSEDLAAAIQEFERAVELDPGYALAWVGIADVSRLLRQYSTMDPKELVAQQEAAIEKALAIDSELGEAQIALGTVREDQMRFEEADAAFRRGIELSPNYVSGYHWYGGFLGDAVDRREEAVGYMDKAVELDPLSSIVQANRYDRLALYGDFERADAQLRQLQQTDPGFVSIYLRLGGYPIDRMMRLDQAIPNLHRAITLDPGNPVYYWLAGLAYTSLGDLEAAAAIQGQIEEVSSDHWSAGAIATEMAIRANNLPGAHESALWTQSRAGGGQDFQQSLVYVAYLQKDYQRARGHLAEAWPQWQDQTQWTKWLARNAFDACTAGWVLAHSGDPDLGRALLEQARDFMLNTAPRHMKLPGRLPASGCLAALGDREGALDHLERSLEFDYSFSSWQIGLGPMYDELRDEPRFQAVMTRMEAKRDEQRANLDRMRAEGLL
jgi:TolB-like protein/Flp pilus assembly protein TadD